MSGLGRIILLVGSACACAGVTVCACERVLKGVLVCYLVCVCEHVGR